MTDQVTDERAPENLKPLMVLMLKNQQETNERLQSLSEAHSKLQETNDQQSKELEELKQQNRKLQEKVDNTQKTIVRRNYVDVALVSALVLSVGVGLWTGAFQRVAIRFGTAMVQGITGNVVSNIGGGIVDTLKGWWPFK